jgi:hypothetical protein
MNLKKYIAESERSYTYKLKTVIPLDDAAMDRIEQVCMRHQPIDISRPRKTIMQKNPIDFQNVDHAEVWIVDFEFGLPVSSYVLGEQIRQALADHLKLVRPVREKDVLVRGTNDPNEVESERLVAGEEIAAEGKEKGMSPEGLLTDDQYSEVEAPDGADLYGKKHNERLLDYLRTVQKEREEASKVDPKSPLFKWMDMPKGADDDDMAFNADIPDAPRLGKANGEGPDEMVSDKGILTDRRKVYKRKYGKSGAEAMLSKETDTRKDPQ